MVPAIIHDAINIPIKKNRNVAAIPTSAPSVIPYSNSLYDTRLINPYIIKNKIEIINGICGALSNFKILIFIINTLTNVTKIASSNEGFWTALIRNIRQPLKQLLDSRIYLTKLQMNSHSI